MPYRLDDKDLYFLKNVKSEDLEDLAQLLLKDFNVSEHLKVKNKLYKEDYNRYWDDIAAEFQLYGGHSLINKIRGNKGALYKEILKDVCDQLKVKYSNSLTITQIENKLLIKVLNDILENDKQKIIEEFKNGNITLDNLSEEEKENLIKELKKEKGVELTPQLLTAILQQLVIKGGFQSYIIAVKIANAVSKQLLKRGLTLAQNATLTRSISILTGPIGWTLTGTWTALKLAGPAYRITIPGVFIIIALRKKYETLN